MSATVVLPPLSPGVNELWNTLLDLAQQVAPGRSPWTLVGGQMVLLHALMHGEVPPQISNDGDVLADIRADPGAITAIVGALGAAGFSVDGISPQGLAHRYTRPVPGPGGLKVLVDVLAPDGVGERADLKTTPPGRTVQVPGGTQALHRTELVTVVHADRTGAVPCPSLLGAIVAKGRACGLPGDPERHHRDLALLCALVDDPFEMRDAMGRKDPAALRRGGTLGNPSHPA